MLCTKCSFIQVCYDNANIIILLLWPPCKTTFAGCVHFLIHDGHINAVLDKQVNFKSGVYTPNLVTVWTTTSAGCIWLTELATAALLTWSCVNAECMHILMHVPPGQTGHLESGRRCTDVFLCVMSFNNVAALNRAYTCLTWYTLIH